MIHTVVFSMAWDGYIDNLISQSKDTSGTTNCVKAAIIGLDGGAPWTTAAHPQGLDVSPTEGSTISAAFKSGDFTVFQAGGIMVEGMKYQFLREEDREIVFGKKKDNGAITLQKSKTAIVIGKTGEGLQQGSCNKAVGVIAEYLEGLGM